MFFMKKFKSIFLVLVIILLSLGFTSTTYARERNGNRIAHDKWNNKGRKGNAGWRFSLDDEEDYENYE
ncbi:hypothetical protein HMPREF0397_1699 [Fusobacterium nucleatum subsp. nucleatum ATCC 23726]|uniref:Uncharacterized protein n=2 Tax=Fusobacterium nucleatum subsp. nucleatum TaxID=76856 RepID=D5RER4_FUSN2|nr:hypothetical protein HMPREF0397_1699 [Fusobacterium nucleatum subsp. nucleatum ATCC 23726]